MLGRKKRYFYHFSISTEAGRIADGTIYTADKILTSSDYNELKRRFIRDGLVKDAEFIITSLTFLGEK